MADYESTERQTTFTGHQGMVDLGAAFWQQPPPSRRARPTITSMFNRSDAFVTTTQSYFQQSAKTSSPKATFHADPLAETLPSVIENQWRAGRAPEVGEEFPRDLTLARAMYAVLGSIDS